MKMKTMGFLLITTAALWTAPAFSDNLEKFPVITDNIQNEEAASETITQDLSLGYTTHLGSNHLYSGSTYYGDQIALEDGNFWIVRPEDRKKLLNWQPGDIVLITKSSWWTEVAHGYPYSLYNSQTGDLIDISPAPIDPYAPPVPVYWIVAIDSTWGNCTIMLNDGSTWILDRSDNHDIWRTWTLGDVIMIGSNSSIFSSWSYPNILINMTYEKNCVEAKNIR